MLSLWLTQAVPNLSYTVYNILIRTFQCTYEHEARLLPQQCLGCFMTNMWREGLGDTYMHMYMVWIRVPRSWWANQITKRK